MFKILILLLLCCAAIVLGPFLSDKQGFVHIATGNYVIETSLTTAVILSVVTFLLVYLLIRVLGKIVNMPGGTANWFKKRSQKKAISKQDHAYIAYAYGDFSKSLELIEKSGAIEELPINALLVSAKSAFNIGDFEYTRQALDEAQKRSSECQEATLVLRAKMNLKVNNPQAAIENLDKLKGSSRNKLIYKLYYDCYKANTAIDKIYEVAGNLVKYKLVTNEDVAEIYEKFFESKLVKANNVEEMEAVYKILDKKNRYKTKFMGPYIRKLIDLNILDKAKSLSLSVLKNNEDPLFLRSIATWKVCIPEVLEFLKKKASKNILENENNLDLLKALGNLSLKANLLEEALGYYKKAISLEKSPDVYAKIGQILSLQQNYPEATEYFSNGYALKENSEATTVRKATEIITKEE